MSDKKFICDFCFKDQDVVALIIASPSVDSHRDGSQSGICNECVALSMNILLDRYEEARKIVTFSATADTAK